MKVRVEHADDRVRVELCDDADHPVPVVSQFLRHLLAAGNSPNTAVAYAHDLKHLWCFLSEHGIAWDELKARNTIVLLEYLRGLSSGRSGRTYPALVTHAGIKQK